MTYKVLIVEDEAIVAIDIAEKLKKLGYDVVGMATRGDEAIALANASRPDVILMDVQLAGEMDGITAAEQIAQTCSSALIFLTANSEKKIRERAQLTIPFVFLRKPFVDGDLLNALETAIAGHRANLPSTE